jgi:hypothetical protein
MQRIAELMDAEYLDASPVLTGGAEVSSSDDIPPSADRVADRKLA